MICCDIILNLCTRRKNSNFYYIIITKLLASVIAKIMKSPQNLGYFLVWIHAHFSFEWDFMVGLWWEAHCSHCKNNKGNAKMLECFIVQSHNYIFLCVVLMLGLGSRCLQPLQKYNGIPEVCLDKLKSENLIFGQTDFTVGFLIPVFPIQYTTFVKLWLQEIGKFWNLGAEMGSQNIWTRHRSQYVIPYRIRMKQHCQLQSFTMWHIAG